MRSSFCYEKVCTISPSVMLAQAMALEKATAKYPIKRVIVKPLSLPYSSTQSSLIVHTGTMPSRLVFGFLDTQSCDGIYTANPFNFKHYNCTQIDLKLSGKSLPYSTSLKFDYAKNLYRSAYNTLFQNIREADNDITYSEYKEGNTIYAFDFTPDLCNSEHYSLLKQGSLELTVNFANIINKSITALFYLEFDNIIEITKERDIIIDYSI